MNILITKKSSKSWLLGIFVTTAMLGSAIVFWQVSQSDRPPPVAQTVPVVNKVTALARLEPETEIINLFAPLALDGDRVKQVLVKQGDSVTEGQIVAVLASEDRLQAALAEAKGEVKVAKNKLAQVKAGAKTGEIIAQKAQIANLEAELQGQIATNQATVNRWQSELRTAKTEYDRHQYLYREGATAASQLDNKRLLWETGQAQLEEALASQNRTIGTLEAQIASARATLNQIAEVRPVDIETAQAEVERAIAGVKRAETELAQAYIRASIAGKVLKIHTKAGEKINEQHGIAELAQTSQMVAVAEVYQTDINRVRLGQQTLISGDVLAEPLKGTVSKIDLQVTRQNVFSNQPGENLDRRVVEVTIKLAPEDSQKVAGLTNLQVQTAILLSTTKAPVSILP